MSTNNNFRIGVDIGGTFTDIVAVRENNGEKFNGKVLTTPMNPSDGVLQGVSEIITNHNINPENCRIIHGTTLVANALIERKGVETALLTTEGFKDVLEIGREWRYDLFSLDLEMPNPIVPRHLRFEIKERLDYKGDILVSLDQNELILIAKKLARLNIKTLAIVFMHSFKNPIHEELAKNIFNKYAPNISLCLSSSVSPEIGEYERTSTTVANAYVQTIFKSYIDSLVKGLKKIGIKNDLFLMLSDGGIVHQKTAVEYPIRLVQSGPAGGAQAATLYGRLANSNDVLCFDMGGTTAKACLIENGKPSRTTVFEVARVYRFAKGSGLPLQVPVIDMIEIGAGGGSIARIDDMGLIQVGPDSSGSFPGPACYNLGGKLPTVTDSDLILGYLDAENFLGGDMKLEKKLAEQSIKTFIADPLKISVVEAAWAIHEIVTENMSQAASIHALEKGRKIEKFTMIPIGGAGPVHACSLMSKMNLKKMISPPDAGVASAVGMTASPNSFELVQADMQKLELLNFTKMKKAFVDMEKKGTKLLLQTGTNNQQISINNSALMRYIGQGYEIEVPINKEVLSLKNINTIKLEFEKVYQNLFGRIEKMPMEIISWRTIASGPLPNFSLNFNVKEKRHSKEKKRKVFFGAKKFNDTIVLNRSSLSKTFKSIGPLIIEERESTLVIPPNFKVQMHTSGSLIIDNIVKD
ncbi:MAG: hydantoinase/oxoprolinase family protein [Proteobacteria bacterium]|jgi:N-methylhydantoinase A|nr:hydantoinase/oxoprolinase family protein [Pseudomonadota bacterium]